MITRQPNDNDLKPFKFGPSFGGKLAISMFSDVKLAIREAIANGLDAETEINAPERIEITIDKQRGVIAFEDWGAGLTQENLSRFLENGVDTYNEQRIGFFGVGKLSLTALGERVRYYSNNGKFGVTLLLMRERGISDPPIYGAVDEYLNHRGTKIVIEEVNDDLTEQDIINKIKERFSLRVIKRKTKITVNDKLVTPQFKFNPADEKHIQTMTGGHKITGQLLANDEGDGGVDVFVKGIMVAHLIVDPTRAFYGWVNCDVLPIDITRNGFRINEKTYKEFLSRMQEEAKKFKKKDIEVSVSTSQILHNLLDMLSSYLRENNFLPVAPKLFPNAKGDEETPFMKPDEEGLQSVGDGKGEGSDNTGSSQPSQETDDKQKAIERKHKGLRFVPTKDGMSKPAIYWLSSWPVDIYINQTHPLTVAFFSERKRGKNLFAMRYFARIAVQINPQIAQLTEEERFVEEDRIYFEFLKRAKVAGEIE